MSLSPRRKRSAAGPGCLLFLGMPVMGFGLWLCAVAVLRVFPAVHPQLLLYTGLGLTTVGLLTFIVRLRRGRQAAFPVVELALAGGQRMRPGASVALRVRQPGPARIDRLKVTLVCERCYSRESTTPGSAAVSAAGGEEVVSTTDLLDERDVRVARGAPFEKIVTLTVPPFAKPTGPVLPSGSIWWHIDVVTEPERGKSLLDQFNVVVVLASDVSVPAAEPGPRKDTSRDLSTADVAAGLAAGVGCWALGLGFFMVGPVFLYLYFSGAATKRGNPVMGLVAGIVFTTLGLMAVSFLIKQVFSGRQSGRRGRLPP